MAARGRSERVKSSSTLSFFSLMYHLLRLLLVILGFATVGISACQKETPSPELAPDSLLVGRWELIQTSGGIAGRTVPADPTQKKEIMFESNGQVQFLLNGAATTSATFTLTQALAHTTNRTEKFVAELDKLIHVESIRKQTEVLNGRPQVDGVEHLGPGL